MIARSMDVFLAFPLLVFAIALVGVLPSSAFGLSGNSLRIGLLIFVIGFSAWPYMGGSSAVRRCPCASASSWTRPAA